VIERLQRLAERVNHDGPYVIGLSAHQAKGKEWDRVGAPWRDVEALDPAPTRRPCRRPVTRQRHAPEALRGPHPRKAANRSSHLKHNLLLDVETPTRRGGVIAGAASGVCSR
jgi:hypothetical protein